MADTKFRNGIEESVWVTFAAAAISRGSDAERACFDADQLLGDYRARMPEDGKLPWGSRTSQPEPSDEPAAPCA